MYGLQSLSVLFHVFICACQCSSCSTWRDGHVVLFRVAPSHGAHAVEAVGCDDRVGLGQGCEGCCGCGGGLGQAQRRRGFRGRLGQCDVGHQVELRRGRANRRTDRSTVNYPCVSDASLAVHISSLIAGGP